MENFSENDAENSWELSQEKKEKLYWNREAIIKDLKEKYLKENDAEIMGNEWKEVHITLPAVWNFEWFKIDYFVSDKKVDNYYFESNPELEKNLKSMKDICEILKAVNRYMAELWVETDGDMDYEKDLQYWRGAKWVECGAWDCLKEITGLDRWYWTSDKNVEGVKNSRLVWCCNTIFGFARAGDGLPANLFLGLSD